MNGKTKIKKLKTVIISAVFFIIAACITALSAYAADSYLIISAAGTPLYQSAGAKSDIVITVSRNAVLPVTEKQGGFGLTKYEGYTGWVELSKVKPYDEKGNAESIKITKRPSKLTYYEDDGLDITGLELEVRNKDGSVSIFKKGFTVLSPLMSGEGKKTVKVMHNSLYAGFDITVKKIPVEKIEITTLPNKTQFYEGKDIDLSGMRITVYYTDGREPLETGEFSVSGYNPYKTGLKDITVYYRYEEFSVSLTVETIPKTLIGIDVKPPDSASIYSDEWPPIFAGMTVTAIYDNGDTETVVANIDYGKLEIGPKTVTVEYGGFKKQFTVNIIKTELITVKIDPPRNHIYLINTLPDLTGLAVYAVYNSGRVTPVPDTDYAVSKIDAGKPGLQEVTVTYKGFRNVFAIYIKGAMLMGDVNLDGEIDAADARLVLRWAAKLEALDDIQLSVADVNMDGDANAADARLILRHVAKLEFIPQM
ncbi:MAG: bacterial Ig-like domain-containing protein [Oscillospiraceae bacterium]|nr:bacterial Ig-like domain-containing protein [Oscillospiraceae bacterium]